MLCQRGKVRGETGGEAAESDGESLVEGKKTEAEEATRAHR